MNTGIFFVKIRSDYERQIREFFPHISNSYIDIARNFNRDKTYPVLSIKEVTLIAENDENIDTSQFLVPTENDNFMWVLAEMFQYAGLTEQK
jgi:hypothetical protein